MRIDQHRLTIGRRSFPLHDILRIEQAGDTVVVSQRESEFRIPSGYQVVGDVNHFIDQANRLVIRAQHTEDREEDLVRIQSILQSDLHSRHF